MLAPDTVLKDRYVIIRKLGSGGQGHVYEALDQNLSCRVAIKEATIDLEEYRHAFNREAKLLANLRHPAFPKVTEFFSQKDTLYLVMEFIPGEDLEHQMFERKSVPFSPFEVMQWADVLLGALDYLHGVNPVDPIIHRDIKPGNIKRTARDEVVLLDFGLARGSAGDMSTMNSKRSVIGYTPGYGPPEQSLRHPIWSESLSISHPERLDRMIAQATDARSDLYSLAATLYRLMTGNVPPDGPKRALAVWSGKPDLLISAQKIVPAIPEAVAAVLQQALALERDERFSSAVEMRQALLEASRSSYSQSASAATEITLPATLPAILPETLPGEAQPPLEITTQPTLLNVKYGTIGKCENSVRAVSFSPDGRFVASGSNDNTVRLWDVVTGDMQLLGQCGTGKSGFSYVSAVAFSPNGEQVVSVSNDKAIRLWGVKNQENRVLGKYRQPLRSVAFSPDGEFVLCGSSDGLVQLWEIETEQMDVLGDCVGVVWSVAFSPDGDSVAAESDDQTIRLWNLRSRLMSQLKSLDGDLRSIVFAPTGKQIAAAGADHSICVWDLSTGERQLIGKCDGIVRSIAYSPDGKTIASASDDKSVRIWNVETKKGKTLGHCDDVVSSVAFASNGKTVASGSWDNTVRLWEVK